MEPHQERVVQEKADLDEKIEKLKEFIANSPIFPKLPGEERYRLDRQLDLMNRYSFILGQRIKAFGC